MSTTTVTSAQPNGVVELLDDVGGFFKRLFTDLAKAKQIFDELSPEVKTVLVPIFQAAVSEAKNISGAVAADGLNITLDVATGTALVALIEQARAGSKSIAADLKTLGIKL